MLLKVYKLVFILFFLLLNNLCNASNDDLKRIEDYLNSIKNLRAKFSQLNPDKSISKGLFFLSRPGKFRLSYKTPNAFLIISDGEKLIYNDGDETTFLPLSSIPVDVLLEDKISLTEKKYIIDLSRQDNKIKLTLRKVSDPDAGFLVIFFSDSPLAIMAWLIRDAQGLDTYVSLSDISIEDKLNPKLFYFNKSIF